MIGYAASVADNLVNWHVTLPFYFGGILWTMVYDTIYAFQDREFDKKLGLNSSALQMESRPHFYLSILSAASLISFGVGGMNAGLGSTFFMGLLGVGMHYGW
jgi:4-hydroxybenzoate polyprenyltransferase